MKRLSMLAMIGVLGCGDDATPEEKLQGSWALDGGPWAGCLYAISFTGMQYETDLVCPLKGGSIGVEAEVGSFSLNGDSMSTTATHATCPDPMLTDILKFSIAGDVLSLAKPKGVLIFRRIERKPSESPGGVIVFGCYEPDRLIPMDIRPVGGA